MTKQKFVIGKQLPRVAETVKVLFSAAYIENIEALVNKMKTSSDLLLSVLKSEDAVPVTVVHLIDECECELLDLKHRISMGNRYACALQSVGVDSAEAMESQEKLVAKLIEKINQLNKIREKYMELIRLSGKNPEEKVEMEFEI